MSVTFTLDISQEILAKAERVAASRHTSLPAVMRDCLDSLAAAAPQVEMTVEEKQEAVRATQGAFTLPPDFDLKKFIAEEKGRLTMTEAKALVDSIGSFVPLPPDFDDRKIIEEERWKKQG